MARSASVRYINNSRDYKIDRTYPKSQFRVEHYKLYRKDRMKGGEA